VTTYVTSVGVNRPLSHHRGRFQLQFAAVLLQIVGSRGMAATGDSDRRP
jgi:hypothetical protein